MELRDYQLEMLEGAREELRAGNRSLILQAPTGAGKTALASSMIRGAVQRQHRIWFVVHRRELLRQSSIAFGDYGIPHGMVSAVSHMDKSQPVQICSIQTLARRLDRLPGPSMIVWDEAHHLAAGTWSKVFALYPTAVHIGLTATPERLDGAGLDAYFRSIVCGPSVQWLIDNGYLAPFRYFSVPSVNTDGVRSGGADFNRKDLAQALDSSTVMGDAVRHYLTHAHGRRAIVFEASVKRSTELATRFRDAGVAAMHVDADTPSADRDRAMADLQSGKLRIITNVDLFGEGVDVPSIEAIFLCRPTQSLTMYLQQVGRGLRMSPGKTDCLIFDHAGNLARHGSPAEEREWSLAGRPKRGDKEKAATASLRQCGQCFAMNPPPALLCLSCGAELPRATREIEQVDGDLTEIDIARLRRQAKKEQAMAGTLEDLITLATMRGYKNPRTWAGYVMKSRELKKQKRMGG